MVDNNGEEREGRPSGHIYGLLYEWICLYSALSGLYVSYLDTLLEAHLRNLHLCVYVAMYVYM
jgi:hypothetical protein